MEMETEKMMATMMMILVLTRTRPHAPPLTHAAHTLSLPLSHALSSAAVDIVDDVLGGLMEEQ